MQAEIYFDPSREIDEDLVKYLHEQARHIDADRDVVDDLFEYITLSSDSRFALGRS